MQRKNRYVRPRIRIATALGLMIIVSLVIPPFSPTYSAARSLIMIDAQESRHVDPGSEPASESESGLQLVLSEGAQQPVQVDAPPLAPTQPLSADEASELLDRLPPLPVEATDEVSFRLPPQPLPPPRTGETIDEAFPPAETESPPAPVESGPLEVLRYAPEGEVRLAPFLNVTFSQPMVPLGTLEDLAGADIPVTLSPALPGVWKWIGTKTLSFEYAGEEGERFPMATEYVAEVPAGTASATGGVLAETVRWTFTTPPPRVLRSEPSYGPQPRDPLMFIAFDQRVDPEAVLDTVQVTASGRTYPVRLATDEEIETDKRIKQLSESSGENRWFAFRPDELLPSDTTVVVNVGPGTPSAEGPLTTEQVQAYNFRTFAPLRIDRHRCGYYDNAVDCPPLTPFEIVFNNPLDLNVFDEAQVTVTPEIPGQVIEVFDTTLRIRGQTAGRTTYQVTVAGVIQDIFGQQLGKDAELTFETGSAPQALLGLDRNLITVDPSLQAPSVTFYSINYMRLRIRAFAVLPHDWPAYQEYLRQYRYDGSTFTPPGQEVLSKVVTIEAEPDTLAETTVDLSSALDGDTGHLIVVVDQPLTSLLRRDHTQGDFLQAWVQVTQIGLDAFVDHSDMVAWTTSLADGKPIADVELALGDANDTSSDANGLARIALPQSPQPILVAQKGSDTAFLPQSMYYWGDNGWNARPVSDAVRWHVFDDRAMYRPGEEVHVKGWVRHIGSRQDADVSLLPGATSVRYQVIDPQGNQLADEVTDVNDLGGFDLAFTLPENANLGHAEIYLSVSTTADVYGADYYHSFQIQEFRRPEFEVKTRPESEGPFFIGDDATVSVHATYFAGGPLAQRRSRLERLRQPRLLLAAQLARLHVRCRGRRGGALRAVLRSLLWRATIRTASYSATTDASRRPLSEHRLPDSD